VLHPSFIIATVMSCFAGYLAIVDPSVRQAFSNLATAAITGYFSLTAPQVQKSKTETDAESK
jgi:hypothetical protein